MTRHAVRFAACALGILLLSCAEAPPDPGAASYVVVSGLRRLSRSEYTRTLGNLLDDTTQSGFAKLPEDATDPFDNDVSTQQVSPALIEALESLAEDAAGRAARSQTVREKIVPCRPTGPEDAACFTQFIKGFGRRALRRPLTEEEVTRYASLQDFSRQAGDFYAGVELVLRSMLSDPSFVYRVEVGEPVAGANGVFRLNGFEVAARLSYFLLGTTPDDALLDAAEGGKLSRPEEVRAAGATLLLQERARERVERFHALWLSFHQLPHPQELTTALRMETAALLKRVIFDERRDYFDLFRLEETFLLPRLAMHYGLPAPADEKGAWVPYGASGRRGLLSHGSVLSAGTKFTDTSPTQRGLFIRTRLLCEPFVPPPPNVDSDNPPPGTGKECKLATYRLHSQGGCAGCHGRTNPVGFGLENYDKAGRYRETEDGRPDCPIDGQGNLAGVGSFHGPGELGELLISSGQLAPCVVRQVYRFALGRRDAEQDQPILDRLGRSFQNSGHSFTELLLDVVSTEGFGYRKEEAP